MRERLQLLGWTLEALATSTGESYRNVRNWVSGDTRVPAHFVARFVEVVSVDGAWLLTGQGSPEPEASDLAVRVVQVVMRVSGDRDLSAGERKARLESALRQLDP